MVSYHGQTLLHQDPVAPSPPSTTRPVFSHNLSALCPWKANLFCASSLTIRDSSSGMVTVRTRSDSKATRALAASTHLGRVDALDVGFQQLGDAGGLALAGLSPRDQLLLQKAGIGGEGARALLSRSRARTLKLEGNPLGRGGLAGLSRVSPALVSLDLTSCGLGAADLTTLASAPATGLRSLVLDYNPTGDAGLRALAGAAWLGQLDALSVMGAKAGDAARTELRRAWGDREGLTLER